MFTVEQRDALRERLLRLAEGDERVEAGAAVGSLAVGGGDRLSDLDLTFAIADRVPVAEVLDDWTRTLVDELDAVQLADLEPARSSTASSCCRTRSIWQAEHYVGAVRDHVLALACLREGVPAVQARGYDDLSAETLARFEVTHICALEPGPLRSALAATVRTLVREGEEAPLPHVDMVAERLAELR